MKINKNKIVTMCSLAFILMQVFLLPFAKITKVEATDQEKNNVLEVREGVLYYENEPLYVGKANEKIPADLNEIMKKGVPVKMSRASGTGASIEYKGQVSWGLHIVGDFSVNGKQAFCLQHPLGTPATGTPNNGLEPYNNDSIRAVLYWGWDGPKNIFTDRNAGIVATSLALSHFYYGDSYNSLPNGYDTLIAKAKAKDFPSNALALNNSNSLVKLPVTYNASTGIQKSATATVNADSGNSISFNIPSGITYVNETTGKTATSGNVTVKGGQKYHFEANASTQASIIHKNLKGTAKEFQPLVIRPSSSGYQDIGTWRWYDDPTKTVSFQAEFVPREGYGKIKKVDEKEHPLSDVEFTIKASDGTTQVKKTNANGEIDVTYLDGIKLEITETKAPHGYVRDQSKKDVTIEATKTKTVTFTNKLQTGKVTLFKQDRETGDTPQGQAMLEHAVYGLYQSDGTKIKEVTLKNIDGKVQASISDLQIEKDYYFQEIKAPTGYNLSTEKISFRIEYAGQDVEVATCSTSAKEDVIKGNIDLIKIGAYDWTKQAWNTLFGNNNDEIKKGLKNVEFTIYEDWGMNKEVATIKTDEQGYASKTGLPYGKYYMEETKTPVGYKKIGRINFEVKTQNQSFHYSVENKVIEAKVKVVKVDSDSGKEIVRSNAGYTFKSVTTGKEYYELDSKGNKISTFYTNDEGYLLMAHMFAYGDYIATEVKAPTGYVVAKDSVKFSVTGNEKDSTVVIRHKNSVQLGEINLTKLVETGINVEEKESTYGNYSAIHFAQEAGEGFKFKIRTTKDIVRGDNSITLKKGEIVQYQGADLVLSTGKDGKVKSPVILEIGSYELVEIEAPKGVILPDKTVPFEIEYAGQSKDITSTSVTVENELQEINIYGHKQQEVVNGWKNGTPIIDLQNANDGQVFALKVRNDLQVGSVTVPSGSSLGFAVVEEGIVKFEKIKLPNVIADYYLEEIDAGVSYQLPESPNNEFNFTYTPATNDKEHEIHVWADSFAENQESLLKVARNPIINKLARANVKLNKLDSLTKQELADVVFNLVQVTEDGETVIRTDATDKNGEINISDLPTGIYKFVETRPLFLYDANGETISFKIDAENNATTIELTANNKKRLPQMGTHLATIDGKTSGVDFTKENNLRDEVNHKDYELGNYVRETEIWEVKEVDGKTVKVGDKPIASMSGKLVIDEHAGKTYVDIKIPANTLKENTTYECIERDYETDKDGNKKQYKPYAEHGESELGNKEQQVTTMKKKVHTLPQTGEQVKKSLVVLGIIVLVGAMSLLYVKKKKSKEKNGTEDK